MQSLADRLRMARKSADDGRGISQAALAEAAGISGAGLSLLESGQSKEMMAKPLLKLARRCGVDPYWLAFGEGEMVTRSSKAKQAETPALLATWFASLSPAQSRRLYDAVAQNPRYQVAERDLDSTSKRLRVKPRAAGRARKAKARR